MNYTIQAVEDALITRIVAQVSYLKTGSLKTIPLDFKMDTLSQQVVHRRPSVLVGFEGMENDISQTDRQQDFYVWREDYRWVLFLIATSFRSVEKVVRGDDTVKGGYDLVYDVTSAVSGIILLAGMTPVTVLSVGLQAHKPGVVIYRVDMTCGQDRSRAATACDVA